MTWRRRHHYIWHFIDLHTDKVTKTYEFDLIFVFCFLFFTKNNYYIWLLSIYGRVKLSVNMKEQDVRCEILEKKSWRRWKGLTRNIGAAFSMWWVDDCVIENSLHFIQSFSLVCINFKHFAYNWIAMNRVNCGVQFSYPRTHTVHICHQNMSFALK